MKLALLMLVVSLGCAAPAKCFRIVSADSWISGGPNSYNTDGDEFTRSSASGWNLETGVSVHWESVCE